LIGNVRVRRADLIRVHVAHDIPAEADAIIDNVGPADTHAAELLKIIDAG
jgi:hypothetical protein